MRIYLLGKTYRLVVLVSEEEIEPELKIRTSDGRVVTERKLNFRVLCGRLAADARTSLTEPEERE